eukprot:TRINITY_DN3248_c0_g1_i1.p1 TRINITY_DN3248_c0_g1~~TRINITY_DN3248_c0_g1_i1.p1  ORF type:complete len:367 (+),score=87.30 TRINITY_DN3248_c0_g1_i1:93-1103(+)
MDLPLSAGLASPLIRRANAEDRANALRRHGSTAIGLTSAAASASHHRFELAECSRAAAKREASVSDRSTADGLSTPSSVSSSSSSSSCCLDALADSIQLKRARELRANALLKGDASRSALVEASSPLWKTCAIGRERTRRLVLEQDEVFPASCGGDRSSHSSSRRPSPFLPPPPPPPPAAEDSDVDLELRLFAALQPSASPSRSLPRQGRPIPTPDALEELVKAETGGGTRSSGRGQQRGLQRGERHAWIAEGTYEAENRLKRRGTGFVRLDRGAGSVLAALDALDDSDIITESHSNSQVALHNWTDSWQAAELLDLSSSNPLKGLCDDLAQSRLR